MFLDISIETWLGFSIVGALVSAVGALLAVAIKDYFFARSFEKWKQKRTVEQLYQRYRDPVFLSACELATRLMELDNNYPTTYLHSEVLSSTPDRQIHNSLEDPYFKKHKLLSSIYRLAAFLGWLELYRQEVTYLRSNQNRHSKSLENAVNFIRSDLADGQLNDAKDWPSWRDTLIFRDELRAIGEAMLENRGTSRAVIGYGHFLGAFESESKNAIKRWAPVVSNFLLDLQPNQKDFRKIRVKKLIVHLVDLMKLLEPKRLESRLLTKRKQLIKELEARSTPQLPSLEPTHSRDAPLRTR